MESGLHFLRCCQTGEVLCTDSSGELSCATLAGDSAMWRRDAEQRLVPATASGPALAAERAPAPKDKWLADDEAEACILLRLPDGELLKDEAGEARVWVATLGPTRLPSELLAAMRREGLAMLENVVSPASRQEIKRAYADRAGVMTQPPMSLTVTPAVARAACHPVAQWVVEQYLGPETRLGHIPGVTLRPLRNGSHFWHTDWPYHGRVSYDGPPQGLQFNICVDEFRADNAATQFQPGSHLSGRGPPRCWQVCSQLSGCFGAFQGVRHMLAPAGAGLLYDARMWHRRCPECNQHPDEDRAAILIPVITRRHKPFMDLKKGAQEFWASATPQALTTRECDFLRRTCF